MSPLLSNLMTFDINTHTNHSDMAKVVARMERRRRADKTSCSVRKKKKKHEREGGAGTNMLIQLAPIFNLQCSSIVTLAYLQMRSTGGKFE